MPRTKSQNPADFSGQKLYVGIDVHKNSWSVTIRSLNLHIEHFSQPPSVKALVNHLQRKYPGGEYYSAYEAGFCGTGIHEDLCKAGVSNTIVHAADIPFTDKQNKNKTDIRDSRAIAFHLEKGNPAWDIYHVQGQAGTKVIIPFSPGQSQGSGTDNYPAKKLPVILRN